MALQSSGAISFSQIKTELTSSSNSLRALSAAAGFSSPDAVSEFYGYTSFTALPPTVTTGGYGTNNTAFSMSGVVNDDGGDTITERGFYFGTSTNRASNAKYIVAGTTGNFNYYAQGLASNTTYYFWAYATNSAGTTYGARNQGATYPTLNYTTAYYGQVYSPYNYLYNPLGRSISEYHSETFYHPYLGGITLTNGDQINLGPVNWSGYSLPGKIGWVTTAGYQTENRRELQTFGTQTWQWYDFEWNDIMAFVHDSPAQLLNHPRVVNSQWYYWTQYGGTANTVANNQTNETRVGFVNTYQQFDGGWQFLKQWTQA